MPKKQDFMERIEILNEYSIAAVELEINGRKEHVVDIVIGTLTKPNDPTKTKRRIRIKPHVLESLVAGLNEALQEIKAQSVPPSGTQKH